MKIGQARIEVNGGSEIANAFSEVKLGRSYRVVVPSLVHIIYDECDDGIVKELFTFRTERPLPRSHRIRILGSCVDTDCSQIWLADRDDKLATEFFTPHEGLTLGIRQMPDVLTHHVGWMGLAGEVAETLGREVQAEPEVGLVTRI